jgi:hypothetical protein
MSSIHLHPADTGGAIMAIDSSDPPEAWRWAGPEWTGQAGTGAPGRITGATVEVLDPHETATRWAQLLGVQDAPDITFREGRGGLVEVALEVPESVARGRDAVEIGGVRFTLAS